MEIFFFLFQWSPLPKRIRVYYLSIIDYYLINYYLINLQFIFVDISPSKMSLMFSLFYDIY